MAPSGYRNGVTLSMTTPVPPPPASTPPPDEAAPDEIREVARADNVLDARWKKAFVVRRENRDFILYAGLLDLAHRKGLKGIATSIVQIPTELNGMTAIVHAVVTMDLEPGKDFASGDFMGLGDANPGNVTRMMIPHLIRMAETRAKARALRDAVNIGMTAFEELGEAAGHDAAAGPPAEPAWGGGSRASSGAAPRRTVQMPSIPGATGPTATGPASAEQLAAIARLMVAAGQEVKTDGLTFDQAGQLIIRLQNAHAVRLSNGATGGAR